MAYLDIHINGAWQRLNPKTGKLEKLTEPKTMHKVPTPPPEGLQKNPGPFPAPPPKTNNPEQKVASPTEEIEKDERVAQVAAWLSNARAFQLQQVTELLANNAIFCTFQIGPADNEN